MDSAVSGGLSLTVSLRSFDGSTVSSSDIDWLSSDSLPYPLRKDRAPAEIFFDMFTTESSGVGKNFFEIVSGLQ